MNYEILTEILDGLVDKPRMYKWERGIPTSTLSANYYQDLTKDDLFHIIGCMDYVIRDAHFSDSDELYSKLYDDILYEFEDVVKEQEVIDSIPEGECYYNLGTGEWEDVGFLKEQYETLINDGILEKEEYPSFGFWLETIIEYGDYQDKEDYIYDHI